jgi:hypothetical protein
VARVQNQSTKTQSAKKGDRKLMKIQKFARRIGLPPLGALLLGACATTDQSGSQKIGSVPEAVLELAGPNQNLATARIREEDGCYWYEHNGPVEKTLLPLRTANGNPICAAQEA